MLYRSLKEIPVSILGFGAMRLPLVGGTQNPTDSFDPARSIDEEETAKMVEYAIEHGVNYFDTAYNYHGGKSEMVFGKLLKPYRDRVTLATKLPVFLAKKREDFDRFLGEQLKRLQTGYLDLYLLHGLNAVTWENAKNLGVFPFLEKAVKEGRVRRVGFSFHDTFAVFKEIADAYDWTMCQIQYNYLDEVYQAGGEGIAYAASKGIGVVVMEPLRGGKLAKVPPQVQELFEASPEKRLPSELALRWVWNRPEVATVLSGMSSLEQVWENVRSAQKGTANSLSPADLLLIDQARNVYRSLLTVNCTGCAYCMPCPSGVNIPMNLSLYNDTMTFKDPTGVLVYNAFLAPEQRASACTECGECEEKCPQHVAIPEELKKVHTRLFREGGQG
ncbi:MAG TPA: aldo/keto reductase [Syntrophorhabdales bacterium]|nr:aldo/keto reductase [Syntrophorhabdales bacterium]